MLCLVQACTSQNTAHDSASASANPEVANTLLSLNLPSWDTFNVDHESFGEWRKHNTVPGDTQTRLDKLAHDYLTQYELDWGAGDPLAADERDRKGLRNKARELFDADLAVILHSETPPSWLAGFIEMTRDFFKLDDNDLLEPIAGEVRNADCGERPVGARRERSFVRFLKGFYLASLATYQGEPSRPSKHGWDGTLIRTSVMPLATAIQAQKEFATVVRELYVASAQAELRAAGVSDAILNEIYWRLEEMRYATFFFAMGANVLLRPYALGLAGLNVMYNVQTQYVGWKSQLDPVADAALIDEIDQTLSDAPASLLEQANAFYYMNGMQLINGEQRASSAAPADVLDLTPGTMVGAFGFAQPSFGALNFSGEYTDVNDFLGLPKEGSAFLHLNRWWEERLRARLSAVNDEQRWLTQETPGALEENWRGFAAHMRMEGAVDDMLERINAFADVHIEDYRNAAAERCASRLNRDATTLNAELTSAHSINAVLAITADWSAAQPNCATLSAEERASLPGLGGSSRTAEQDKVILDAAVTHVKDFIGAHYYKTELTDTSGKKWTLRELSDLVKISVNKQLANRSDTTKESMQIGTAEFLSMLKLYTTTLFHELYHAMHFRIYRDFYGSRYDAAAVGVHMEGNNVYSEEALLEIFLPWFWRNVPETDPAYFSKEQLANLKLYDLEFANMRRATMVATAHIVSKHFDPEILATLPRPEGLSLEDYTSSGVNTQDYAKAIAQLRWNVTEDKALQFVQLRSHQGYDYLSYWIGAPEVKRRISKLKQMPEYEGLLVDPFSLLACKRVAFSDHEAGLSDCLPQQPAADVTH